MNQIIIALSSVGVVGILLYLVMRGEVSAIKKIDKRIRKDAMDRDLDVLEIIYPTFSHWNRSPFEREIKIGTLGLHGIPTNQEYYRILSVNDKKEKVRKIYWVKVVDDKRRRELILEWCEEANNG